MNKYNEIRMNKQLGINRSTANMRLRKRIMFELVKELGKDICYQCKKKIDKLEEFTIEHKVPWLDSEDPLKLFYSYDNIAFAHYKCNVGAARRPHKIRGIFDPKMIHGHEGYKRGCRCEKCVNTMKEKGRRYRLKRKRIKTGGLSSGLGREL